MAQSHTIRITHNTNLRASYSLHGRIIETAPAGTTLHVIGSHNRWLRVSRSGGDAWMADWVAYTRVEDSARPTQSQSTSNIDNCCFVDRQCQTDQEWTDGYWAFQNGQCAAPTQTLTSTQPASNDTGQTDNCCFIGWPCATDDDWLEGFQAYQTNQCIHPGIALEGSPGFILQMEQALDVLQSLSPKWYQYVINGLDRIRQTPQGIIGVHVGGRHFDLSYADDLPPGRDFYEHTLYTGTVFIHEACHVFRYEAGLESGGLEGETACVETVLAALLEYAPDSPEVENNRRVLANIHRPECQWWWGEYKTCYD